MRPFDPRLLRHARASTTHLAVLTAIGAATAALVITQATLLADAIAATVDADSATRVTTTLALLAGVVAARAALAWLTESASYHAAARVKSALRRQLISHALRLGPRWLTGGRTGELTNLTTRGIDALDAYFARYLPQLVLAVIVPAAVLLAIAPTDWIAAATIAATLPLIPIFMILVGLATQAYTRRRWHALGRLSHHFLDVVAGLPTLKVFGRAHAQAANLQRIGERYRRATMGTLRIAFLSSLVLELAATLSVALVAVGIGLRLVGGNLDLRTALFVLILAPEAYLPLRAVGTHFHASADGLAAAEETFAILETPARRTGERQAPTNPREIKIDNLRVHHPDRSAAAPDGFSVTLTAGELTVLTGPSGAGKSTLIAALLGFVAPDSGTIAVDRTNLTDIDPTSWRERVAWVPQTPSLFAGTVADNIRLGRPDATDTAVATAAQSARLTDLALETAVGEGGRSLSAGQQRRVAIARALLRGTPVILLDEPTAGLDTATEAAVLRHLLTTATDGKLVVIVAHRPAVLATAHRVVVMTPTATPALSHARTQGGAA